MYFDPNSMDTSVLVDMEKQNTQAAYEFMPVQSLKATLTRVHGKHYAWSIGEEKEGLVGFGETPYLAMLDFNKKFYHQKA